MAQGTCPQLYGTLKWLSQTRKLRLKVGTHLSPLKNPKIQKIRKSKKLENPKKSENPKN